jgi:hypothetical protein
VVKPKRCTRLTEAVIVREQRNETYCPSAEGWQEIFSYISFAIASIFFSSLVTLNHAYVIADTYGVPVFDWKRKIWPKSLYYPRKEGRWCVSLFAIQIADFLAPVASKNIVLFRCTKMPQHTTHTPTGGVFS